MQLARDPQGPQACSALGASPLHSLGLHFQICKMGRHPAASQGPSHSGVPSLPWDVHSKKENWPKGREAFFSPRSRPRALLGGRACEAPPAVGRAEVVPSELGWGQLGKSWRKGQERSSKLFRATGKESSYNGSKWNRSMAKALTRGSPYPTSLGTQPPGACINTSHPTPWLGSPKAVMC